MTDALDSAVRAIRDTKESTVRSGQRDLLPVIVIYRGDQLIAMVEGSSVNRDEMLQLASVAAAGYEADVVATSFETWMAQNMRENPLTGRPWEPGDMQDAVENHNARAEGWIMDALMVSAVNRAGDFVARTIPYRLKGRRVEWIDHAMPPEDADYEGFIADFMRQMMLRPSMMGARDMLAGQELFGLSEERAWAHRDCAITKLMVDPPPHWQAEGFPEDVSIALGMDPGTVREQVIRSSMPNGRRLRWEK